MRRLILESDLSLGDIVMLTAAVRDLHLSYPGQFATDVRTPFPDLWKGNPYITPLAKSDRNTEVIYCDCPLIHRANDAPYHYLHAFSEFLNERLGLAIKLTRNGGDIHLLPQERTAPSLVAERLGLEIPYWIIVAGGKYDYTIKWWSDRRYQEVVDHFRGRIQFVQVGSDKDYHPTLDGVLDLTGQTSVRELLRLVYRAQGVLCGVTSLMHLAAAVPCHSPRHITRPCVVVAGGREPTNWEAYPHHQFIHTIGALPCCRDGGCWKSRTFSLGDGSELDRPESLCTDVVGSLPKCMHLITAAQVIQRVQGYFDGGALSYLSPSQVAHVQPLGGGSLSRRSLGVENAQEAASRFLRRLPKMRKRPSGRGILLTAETGSLPAAWIAVRLLRHLGCALPIELWQAAPTPVDELLGHALAPYSVTFRLPTPAPEPGADHPANAEGLKLHALAHSDFREVLLLEAETWPVRNPEDLFREPTYRRTRAAFWPGDQRLEHHRSLWRLCGVPPLDEPQLDSSPVLLDRVQVWDALCLARWYDAQPELFGRHMDGDYDSLHMALRKLGRDFVLPASPSVRLGSVRFQHDFTGRRLFQQLLRRKWKGQPIADFPTDFVHGDVCRQYLAELRTLWPARTAPFLSPTPLGPPMPGGAAATTSVMLRNSSD